MNAGSLPDYVLAKPYYKPPYGYQGHGWVSWDDWFGKENPTLGDLADAVTKVESKTERDRIRKQKQRDQKKRKKEEEEETLAAASVRVASGNSTASTGPSRPLTATPPLATPWREVSHTPH